MDVDFSQSTPFVVTFTAGSVNGSTADVSVMILDDDLVEEPETFDLSISYVNSDAEISTTSVTDTATVTIMDGDCKWSTHNSL